MTTYREMADRARPESAAALAHVLLRIYEANRTENSGLVNGEAVLSPSFAIEARAALAEAGVVDYEDERPGHDAPMPTREAHTAEDFDRALGLYLEGVKAIKAAYYDRMGYAHGAGELFDFDVVADKPGPRFIRVVNMEARGNGSSRFLERASVYSFVERATGDVYKPESFTKPAKHVRSNIFSAKHGTERHNWHGPEYLR